MGELFFLAWSLHEVHGFPLSTVDAMHLPAAISLFGLHNLVL